MSNNIQYGGIPLSEAKKALVLVHGRGGSAGDILQLSQHLNVADFALVAPEANGNTWYPYSFMEDTTSNQPALTTSLNFIDLAVDQIKASGILDENIYFVGFSQGACLVLEYVASHARQFGGVAAFTGGLIGKSIEFSKYTGDFGGTSILICTGNPDPHVPLSRVEETAVVLRKMNVNVILKVFDNKPHSISQNEIDLANQHIFI